jgi:hypothetical protein
MQVDQSTVTVRFLIPWRNYAPGQIIEPTPGQAEEMIRRGIVEKVEEEKPRKRKQYMVPQDA